MWDRVRGCHSKPIPLHGLLSLENQCDSKLTVIHSAYPSKVTNIHIIYVMTVPSPHNAYIMVTDTDGLTIMMVYGGEDG